MIVKRNRIVSIVSLITCSAWPGTVRRVSKAPVRDADKAGFLFGFTVFIGILVLVVGGGLLGAYAAEKGMARIGLLDLEPALAVPAGIAGIAVGGLTGVAVLVGLIALPRLLRDPRPGAAGLVGKAVAATALGVIAYLVVIGGLVWLVGLILPETVTTVLAVLISIAGLPFAGPIAYQLITGRAADAHPGGTPLPRWVGKVRRRP